MMDHVLVVNELVSKNILRREAGRHAKQNGKDCYSCVKIEQPCRSSLDAVKLRQGNVTVHSQNFI